MVICASDLKVENPMRTLLIEMLLRLWDKVFPPNPLSHLLNSLPDPAFAIDLRGRVIYWNAAIEQLTGVSAKDMLGRGSLAYAVPFYGHKRPLLIDGLFMTPDELLTWYPQAKRQGETLSAHGETNDLRGGYGYLTMLVSPIRDRWGRCIGAIEQVRDETALRKSEEMVHTLSLAVAQSPNGTFITNADGRFEYVNAAFEAMYGYTSKEVIGARTSILNSGLTPLETVSQMWAALKAGESWKGDFINKRKDGEIRNIFSRVAPIRQADGQVTRYLAIQEDTTERKRMGLELDRHRFQLAELVVERTAELARLKEAAESANDAKSAFLANMSHEIRTPMNGIIGLTRIVHQHTTDPAHRRQLGRVIETAQSLLQIINDILDISKIEANKLSLESVDFHLAPLISRQMDMVRTAAVAKGLKLGHQVDPALLGPLLGDPLRIGQVLLNFLGNAVKFTEHGEVQTRVTLDRVDLVEGDETLVVLFEVIDTGIGIAEEACQRLFNAFEQADVSTTRKFGGTGLGLVISQRLAQMMGGEVGVESQLGQGSRFWFSVRLQHGKGARIGSHEPVGPQDQATLLQDLATAHQGARILLVEDNEINQEVALSLLEGTGFSVDVAENGAQAVQKARSQGYDLVLMDIQMPVMDGLAATKLIRGLAWHHETPILAMTANAFDEDRRACLAAGMNDHIGKPIVPASLYLSLQKWLANRSKQARAPVLACVAAKADDVAHLPGVTATGSVAEAADHDVFAGLRTSGVVDVDAGLASTGGREKTYLRVLRRFLESQPADQAALASALQQITDPDKHAQALRQAHSLKGLAGTLGFPDLQRHAAALEQAIKVGETERSILLLAEALSGARQTLVDILAAQLPLD